MMKKLLSLGAVALFVLGEVSAIHTNGWVKQHKASANTSVRITFPIKQSNLGELEKRFWQISNPTHHKYGKHMSFHAVGQLVKNDNATHAVVHYLKSLGIDAKHIRISPHGTFISAPMHVSMANEAFHANFHRYAHPDSKVSIVKTEHSALPHELKEFVTHIPHVSYFPPLTHKAVFDPDLRINSNAAVADAAALGYVTPQVLFNYYGVADPTATNGATQSVFEALGQDFDNADLNMFQSQFGVTVQDIDQVIGTNTESVCFTTPNDCGEANLDVQYMMAMAQGAPTVYWSITAAANDPFVDWAEQLAQYSNLPQVHSISYGGAEAGTTANDMNIFNTEVQKLGVQGISVMVSSGDDGVAGPGARNNAAACAYTPQWPASSPYVTTVGATQGPESGQTEIACSAATGGGITTGGGFSNIFAQPAYQQNAVATYFNSVNQAPAAGFQAQGRAYPDVSLMGFNYAVALGAQFQLESGTSASSPSFAGMITLVNDARIAQGKAPLGFLNQALYSLDAGVWTDIVTGDNRCVANPQICCTQGFFAAAGWDPVTGLGTPNFAAMSAALIAL